MKTVFLYSHKSERVTRLIDELIVARGGRSQSLAELSEKNIWESLHDTQPLLKGPLVERIFGIPPEVLDQYKENDKNHAKFEWYAYLQYLRSTFATISMTLNNPFVYKWNHSLSHQYLTVARTCPQLKIPKHGYVRHLSESLRSHPGIIYKKNPFDLYNWKPNKTAWISDSCETDFCVIRPEGEIVHALNVGAQTSYHGGHLTVREQKNLGAFIGKINCVHGALVKEFLFFKNPDQSFTFGMYSSLVSMAFGDDEIKASLTSAFERGDF